MGKRVGCRKDEHRFIDLVQNNNAGLNQPDAWTFSCNAYRAVWQGCHLMVRPDADC